MTTPEGKVKAAVKDLMRRRGYVRFPVVVVAGMPRGTPDALCCAKGGVFLAVEAKAGPKSELTFQQAICLWNVVNAGGCAVVAHSGNLDRLDAACDAVESGGYSKLAPVLASTLGPPSVESAKEWAAAVKAALSGWF